MGNSTQPLQLPLPKTFHGNHCAKCERRFYEGFVVNAEKGLGEVTQAIGRKTAMSKALGLTKQEQ